MENQLTELFRGKYFPAYGGKLFSSENNFPLLFLPNNVKWENHFSRK